MEYIGVMDTLKDGCGCLELALMRTGGKRW
jgi:hypothetical protein